MSTKKQNLKDDIFIKEDDPNYYSFPPMFRYEYEEAPAEVFAQTPKNSPPLPTMPEDQFVDPTLTNIAYTQAFMRTLIGKRVRVTFLIGTNTMTDRTGTLENVGTSYIVIKMPESNTHIMCDLYSIKFVDYYA